MSYGYGFASCGCPKSGMGADHYRGCTGTATHTHTPERPKPPPIWPGSQVRLADEYRFAAGLRDGEIYTVEGLEDRRGQVFVFLVGDAWPWKIERFVADV
jgi:hypothetical protein